MRKLTQIYNPILTLEAKIHLSMWNKNSTLLFYDDLNDKSNWILAYDTIKKYFISLSIINSCLSTTFGSINHVQSLYPTFTLININKL